MTNKNPYPESRGIIHTKCPARINVLLVGGGGREHALAWKMSQSPKLGNLWLTNPENPGLAELGKPCPLTLDYREIWRFKKWCDKENIDLVVVGPETPLADGIVNKLADKNLLVFGPAKAGARIEADKAWAKQLMRSAAVPTAEARIFTNYDKARQYIESRDDDLVIKASGLAAGKGVLLPETPEQAIEALDRIMLHNEFGKAGTKIIVEEKLAGPEISILALVDGKTIYLLETARDHKRLLENNQGPNTGGMGAYSPADNLDQNILTIIEREILVPTIDAMRRDEIEYRGVLYAGLMLTPAGPKVLEFNCRFGDPECQPLMTRMKSDLVEILWSTAAGRLDKVIIDWDNRHSCCVVMTSKGYPGKYKTMLPITGIEQAEALGDVKVFHAGTRIKNGQLVTAGGRVLGITAIADSLAEARTLANQACETINFEGKYYRKDIAQEALTKCQQL